MAQHNTLETCPQSPVIADLKETMGRVAIALETIAAQGVSVASHEKRLDGHDKNVSELYGLVRKVEAGIYAINTRHAKEEGVEEVKTEERKFWQQIKVQLTPYALSLTIFVIFTLDKLHLVEKIAKLWKEMKG